MPRSDLEETRGRPDLLAVAMAAPPGLAAASVTAIDEDGSLTTAASTDEAARIVDQHEYDAEEGPCFVAIATGEEKLVDDVDIDPRWPGFNARARAARRYRHLLDGRFSLERGAAIDAPTPADVTDTARS